MLWLMSKLHRDVEHDGWFARQGIDENDIFSLEVSEVIVIDNDPVVRTAVSVTTFELTSDCDLNAEVVTAVAIWDDGDTNVTSDETAEQLGIRPIDVVCVSHNDDHYSWFVQEGKKFFPERSNLQENKILQFL